MKRWIVIVVAVVSTALAAGVAFATSAPIVPAPDVPDPNIGPNPPADTGAGELLLVVFGGAYPSRYEAEAGNASMPFGDVAGYYVVPVAQFQGFREQIGDAGDFALVSVFRTVRGAREFIDLAHGFGYPAELLATRVRSLGGLYAGLGQEEDPDGSGPLLHPIAESLP